MSCEPFTNSFKTKLFTTETSHMTSFYIMAIKVLKRPFSFKRLQSFTQNKKCEKKNQTNRELTLTLSRRRSQSYRNQSTDLLCKSMDWFLYDTNLHHERVKTFLKTDEIFYHNQDKMKETNFFFWIKSTNSLKLRPNSLFKSSILRYRKYALKLSNHFLKHSLSFWYVKCFSWFLVLL